MSPADRTRSKKITQEIYKKHGLDKKVKKDEVAARVAGAPADAVVITVASLKAQAKAAGIKNFQILHKDELIQVLDPKRGPTTIDIIVKEAVARWKAGFGTRGKRTEVKAKPAMEVSEIIK
jgi:hypothetical protein